ncbi:MAG: hypothetical protein ACYTDT_00330 [Planctomycetota bacterium]|jgi:hypothetical protein
MHAIEDHIAGSMAEFAEVVEGRSAYVRPRGGKASRPDLSVAPYLNDYGWFLIVGLQFARNSLAAGHANYAASRATNEDAHVRDYTELIEKLAAPNLHRLERRLQELEDLSNADELKEAGTELAKASLAEHAKSLGDLLQSALPTISAALLGVRRANEQDKQTTYRRDSLSELDNLEIGLGRLVAEIKKL